ncbi:protein mo25 [Anaeramoeba ignava]|uniref:Protein mo25 n=1 Tax=Anaeramoeba ignava TaxID=1746090 RepID=A0A9Q0R4Z2_ANAIG|nr:protein mo25 [Anaeramoeba ignava]
MTQLTNEIIGQEILGNLITLNTGMMIRECIQNEKLTEVILKSKNFEKFFDYVQLSDFDSASDAFTTLQSLLTKHPDVLSTFLTENYSRVIDKMNLLLKSENYVTARQTLKLLSEILLNRSNFKNMTRYISDVENLKLIMNLLRDPRKAIQFEAFQIFKLFVANPKKEDPIVKILAKNKEKLLSFLKQFHNDRDDDQFKEDKSILLKEVAKLPDLQ